MEKRETEILEKSSSLIRDYLNPSRILLFGSRAKGNNTKHSDFDFAVDLSKPDSKLLSKLLDELESISGLYKIDLVFLNELDSEFKNIILNHSKIIYER